MLTTLPSATWAPNRGFNSGSAAAPRGSRTGGHASRARRETIESSGYGLDDLLSGRLSGSADRAARGANAVESARRSAPTTKTVADRAAAARGHGREEA